MRWGPISAKAASAGLQIMGAVSLLMALAFAPPARGPMLLVPLTGPAASKMVRTAVAHGALLLGPGPIRGSVVMFAREAGLTSALLGSGVITMAAPSSLCGDVASGGNE